MHHWVERSCSCSCCLRTAVFVRRAGLQQTEGIFRFALRSVEFNLVQMISCPLERGTLVAALAAAPRPHDRRAFELALLPALGASFGDEAAADPICDFLLACKMS